MHAFLWQPGSGPPTDLGTLDGDSTSYARAVNQAGRVVGSSTPSSGYDHNHAFSWTPTVPNGPSGSMTGLGALPTDSASAANAINTATSVQVVGNSVHGTGINVGYRAVLWQNGKVIDLVKQIPSRSGWSALANATGVNGTGQIVGQGVAPSGNRHAFLLTPSPGGSPLTAAALPGAAVTQTLHQEQVAPLLSDALTRWQAAGVDTSGLGDIQILIANFAGRTLGPASGHTIALDDNAGGWGWFVDPTPADDSGFTAGNQGEQHRMDLRSAVMHELGHPLGYEHDDHDDAVMAATL
jgi:probable HAF family extracellular repeat protein